MNRVRGHRIAGPVPIHVQGERHYFAAAMAVVGIGTAVYGYLSQPSGKVPTAVRARMAEDRARADRAYEMAEMLLPYQLDAAGLEPVYTNGKITGVQKKPLTTTQKREEEIRALADEKVLKGLKGELDIDPGATRSLNEQDAQRTEYLLRTQGPDYKLGTAGATQIERGQESRNIQESALRRGEMSAAEAIANAARQNAQFEQNSAQGLLRGVPAGLLGASLQDPYATAMMDRQYGIDMGKSRGLVDIGSSLMRGAGALYGAGQGGQRAYRPSSTGMNPTPGGTYEGVN
jgi:hypothetical protein